VSLTIVTYHYVRDLARSRFPSLKARDLSQFKFQLDYIAHNYRVVTAEQVTNALSGDTALPENAIWLTFDDGYIDHYESVLPLLQARGWQGSFFPPAHAIVDGALLDVNKIQFLLAALDSPLPLLAAIRDYVDANREAGLKTFEHYDHETPKTRRYDGPEIAFIKRMLQDALPDPHRAQLLDALFRKFVTDDAIGFARELYLSSDQIRTMIDAGMHFGGHGYKHVRLAGLPGASLRSEVELTVAFLGSIGVSLQDWIMCYPYGSHDETAHAMLRDHGCRLALTTRPAVADIDRDHLLALPRLDTNDLPCT
jgi:peptidoglycan/xylan/chitin deacetylase (PgdA/CDA1 family)